MDWLAANPDLAAPCEPVDLSEVNPLVEGLLECQTVAERAQWLLQVPLGFVVERHKEINAALSHAGYHNGLTYVALLLTVLSQRRDADGYHSLAMSRALDRAAVFVRLDARPDSALLDPARVGRVLGAAADQSGSEKA